MILRTHTDVSMLCMVPTSKLQIAKVMLFDEDN